MSEWSERQFLTRYHARWVVPVSAPPIGDGTVVVEGDRIVWVGRRAQAPAGRDHELGNAVLLPGLVNAHTHLDLTVMRRMLDGLSFYSWVPTLTAARREVLTPDDLLESAREGIREGLLAGITTYADTSPADAALVAMLDLGVRGIAYREVFGPDPAHCDAAMRQLRDEVRAMRDVARDRGTTIVRVGISPHAPYSVSDALFAAAAGYARAEGLPLATHVAESDEESRLVEHGEGAFADFLRGRGIDVARRARSPLALLEHCGVLEADPLLIHCVRVDAHDIRAVGDRALGVAHCPASNAWFSHGASPVAALLQAGARIGLGTDSLASNHGMDLLREALLASPSIASPPDAARALELATLGGARALRLDAEVGTLECGKQADLAAFRILAGADMAVDAVASLLAGAREQSAVLTVVAGHVRVRDGRVIEPAGVAMAGAAVCASARVRLAAWFSDL